MIGFPDVHPGPAYPVGIAVRSEGVFYPQLVGGDIGCGIGLWKTGLHRRKPRIELDSNEAGNELSVIAGLLASNQCLPKT